MPLQRANIDGKPGWRWGKTGKIYTYTPGDKASETRARNRALDQAIAIGELYSWMVDRLQQMRHKFFAETYNDYPKAARDNAKKVLDWIDEHGRDQVQGATAVGLARANQLAKGENLTLDTVKRMSAFERHRQNAEIAPEFRGTPWKDRGYVAWLAWGGDEGIAWAKRKIEQVERNDDR